METDLANLRSELSGIALEISTRLERLQFAKIVFAESCTAGMIAATMGGVPGISRFLCGSAVTYREATKTEWLGVSAEMIQEHSAESAFVSQNMAALVMARTPEATISLAITGHLGPGVDEAKDGLVFVKIFQRYPDGFDMIGGGDFRLRATGRIERQTEATWRALQCLDQTLGQIEISRK